MVWENNVPFSPVYGERTGRLLALVDWDRRRVRVRRGRWEDEGGHGEVGYLIDDGPQGAPERTTTGLRSEYVTP